MTADRIVMLDGSGGIHETGTHTKPLATGAPTPITGPKGVEAAGWQLVPHP